MLWRWYKMRLPFSPKSFPYKSSLILILGMGMSRAMPLLFGIFLTRNYGHDAYASFVLLLSLVGLLTSAATMNIVPNILSAPPLVKDGGKAVAQYAIAGFMMTAVAALVACVVLSLFPNWGVAAKYGNLYPHYFDLVYIATYGVGFSLLQLVVAQYNQRCRHEQAGYAALVVMSAAYGSGMLAYYVGMDVCRVLGTIGAVFLAGTAWLCLRINAAVWREQGLGALIRSTFALLKQEKVNFYLPSLFTGLLLLTQYELLAGVANHMPAADAATFSLAFQLFAIGLFIPGILGHVVLPQLGLDQHKQPEKTGIFSRMELLCFAIYALIGIGWVGASTLGLPIVMTYYKLPDTDATRQVIFTMQLAALVAAIHAVNNQMFILRKRYLLLTGLAMTFFAVTLGWAGLHGFTTTSAATGFLLGYTTIFAVAMTLRVREGKAALDASVSGVDASDRMRIMIVGKVPPPIGGITVHTQRLIAWLAQLPVQVRQVDVTPRAMLRGWWMLATSRRQPTVVHCQTSSWIGVLAVVLMRMLAVSRAKLMFSIHSEYWVGSNLAGGGARQRLVRWLVRRLDLVIADNPQIERDVAPYARRTTIISPFLPPSGVLQAGKLSEYLGLPAFDAPVMVFNAYKLVYRETGEDVYGLDTLLNAYLSLPVPLTLILLIPQLTPPQRDMIEATIRAANSPNGGRVHIIARNDLDGWKIIARADLFVRPTITDGDALSLREALFFGTPTIASDCTMRPEGTILFRTGDADDLAAKLMGTLAKDAIQRTSGHVESNPATPFYTLYQGLFV